MKIDLMFKLLVFIITLGSVFIISSCFFNPAGEVLESFSNIEKGIEKTVASTNSKNETKWEKLCKKLETLNKPNLKEKVYTSGAIVKKQCDSLYRFIENLKKQAVEIDCNQSYDDYKNTYALTDPKNITVSNVLMLTKSEHKTSLGDSLKQQINFTRKLIVNELELMQGNFYDEIEGDKYITLRAEGRVDSRYESWEEATFKSIPRGAVIALLTKFQNDVKNAESEYFTQTLKFVSNF